METLTELASGTLPKQFPFKFSSPYDPTSPWSLIIAFYPETHSLPKLNFEHAETSDEVSAEFVEFVRGECINKGWIPESDPITQFLKLWMRLTDEMSHQLLIPADTTGADQTWIDGCVRVLKLVRNSSEFSYSLRDFENCEPAKMFDLLIMHRPQKFTSKQLLEFILVPYCRFIKRFDLLNVFVENLPLEDVNSALFVPELLPVVVERCLSTLDWRAVEHIVENIPHEFYTPKLGSTIALLKQLVPVAKMAKLPAENFRQLVEWSTASSDTQQDVLRRMLLQTKPIQSEELLTMRHAVFSNISEEDFVKESISSSLQKSRFMFLKSLPLEQHQQFVNGEVRKLAGQFGENNPSVSLQQIVTAVELTDDSELKRKFAFLMQLHRSFGIDPQFALHNERLEIVSKILELDSQSYLRYTDLITMVGGEGESKDNTFAAKVAELCVESALANDDFSSACEYFERKFIQDTSPTAWLAYYQAGKYISPQWNVPKPASIVYKQQQLMSQSLDLCPEEDINTVLKAWGSLDAEINEIESVVEQLPSNEPDVPELVQDSNNTRDQLSNLLVSGLGWAIGAKP